jgi:hypothetical protein
MSDFVVMVYAHNLSISQLLAFEFSLHPHCNYSGNTVSSISTRRFTKPLCYQVNT